MITIQKCNWSDIKHAVKTYYEANNITIESYWEDHILESTHYQLMSENEPVGFFAIHQQSMITLFHLTEAYAKFGQQVFAKIKQYEQVTNAFVTTGDEFFLSHCLDSYMRLEKQAYLSVYTDQPLQNEYQRQLVFKEVTSQEDIQLFDLAGDFFEDGSAQKIREGLEYFKVYLVHENNELIGFGVIEYSRVVSTIGSAGMYVLEEKRQQGYAACILKDLQHMIEQNGRKAHSGCWYYNHNSKKSMESAGAYSKTRLLRFYF